MWHLHPVLCENVTIRDVTVDTPRGPNTDGCNPESCTDVHVEGCRFNTGDDCLAIKAGKNADGRRVDAPCENVVVEDCEMHESGGVVIGSEMSGGVENVFARDCRMTAIGRPLRIKANPERGGYVRDVHFLNIRVDGAHGAAIEGALDYANVTAGSHPPDVRNVDIRDMTVDGAERALYLIGNDDNPIRDVRLTDCVFEGMAEENVIENVEGLVLDDVRM